MARKSGSGDGENSEIEHQALMDVVMEFMKAKRGWAPLEELEIHVETVFDLTKRDRERIGRGRPRWKNRLDWVKAKLTHWMHVTPPIDGERYVFVPSLRRGKSGFKKACPNCGSQRPLGEKVCKGCGYKFPPSPPRHRRRNNG